MLKEAIISLFKLDQSLLMHLESNTGDYQTDIRLAREELTQPRALRRDVATTIE